MEKVVKRSGGKATEEGLIVFQLTSRFRRDRYPYRGPLSNPRSRKSLTIARYNGEKVEPQHRLLLIPLPLCFSAARGIVNGAAASRCGWPSLSSGKSVPRQWGTMQDRKVHRERRTLTIKSTIKTSRKLQLGVNVFCIRWEFELTRCVLIFPKNFFLLKEEYNRLFLSPSKISID